MAERCGAELADAEGPVQIWSPPKVENARRPRTAVSMPLPTSHVAEEKPTLPISPPVFKHEHRSIRMNSSATELDLQMNTSPLAEMRRLQRRCEEFLRSQGLEPA